jgi:hypothetical protein
MRITAENRQYESILKRTKQPRTSEKSQAFLLESCAFLGLYRQIYDIIGNA